MSCDALSFFGLDGPCHHLVDYLTDPFWFYLFCGCIAIAIASFLGWFFDVLRPISGAAIISIILGLFAYRKGENDQAKRDKREMDRIRQKQNRQGQPDWKWPWDN